MQTTVALVGMETQDAFQNVGTTPLGSNLDRKVLQPMVLNQARSGSMQKPVLVICITDGEPTGEPKDATRQVVMNAKNQLQSSPYGPGAVAFQFAQVSMHAQFQNLQPSMRLIACFSASNKSSL